VVREAREREEEGRRRVAGERLRIARELHDTLAHSLVAINVRAGVAVDLGSSQDPLAALEDIKQASATALRDLRATLSLLRDQDETAPTTPAFDIESLPRLVADARSAGLRADVDVQLDGAAVPSAIGGAVFRIVQEALTNVLRHADASSAQVRVQASAGTLDVEVADDGRGDEGGIHPGLGLRGMAERAAALGGRVDVGPRDGGGWCVHAVLPLGTGELQ
jgi:signal transduction histidine kinase